MCVCVLPCVIACVRACVHLSHSALNPKLSKIYSLKPGMSQKVASHTTPAGGNTVYRTNFCLPADSDVISPKPLQI